MARDKIQPAINKIQHENIIQVRNCFLIGCGGCWPDPHWLRRLHLLLFLLFASDVFNGARILQKCRKNNQRENRNEHDVESKHAKGTLNEEVADTKTGNKTGAKHIYRELVKNTNKSPLKLC